MTMTNNDETSKGYYAPTEAVLRRFAELLRREEAERRPVSLTRLWQEAGGALAVRLAIHEGDEVMVEALALAEAMQ